MKIFLPPHSVDIKNSTFPHFKNDRNCTQIVLFPHCPEIQFIIEFIYDDDSAKLNYLLEWIHRNRTQILGIKITDLFADLSGFQSCIPSLIRLKNELPANYVWILSGKIFPQDYALAIYLGFDIIDVRSEILFGMDGLYIGANQRRWIPGNSDTTMSMRCVSPSTYIDPDWRFTKSSALDSRTQSLSIFNRNIANSSAIK